MSFSTNEELYADLDMRSREERLQDDNKAALAKPEPGDYWHEMLAPVSLVIAVVGNQVATFEHYKDEKPSGYSYDTDKITWRSLDDFRTWLRYDSPSMNGKTWADVVRKSQRLKVIEQCRAEGGVL